ncbi:Adenylate and Guanylate cyclase catalytic domain containing protein [Tritrichomonas foetus]|uniref:Adenylate and Guanylate cyclase catalytic domain containing protein n=1 Tax=Tritrichomonas foetus TaxID=1144522 RepID=A0A1J4JB20_9EUKA|nr:Adenylate and Guanylate cyclase catalytic domain containing protein [Tritrichomonas foetus]|eukprot:OHS95865.1 Adenylate and Guanylate cyclase catalytic domain containing protein [Tritrichomonas foetus]
MFDGIVPQMKDMMAAAIPKTQIPVIILLFLGLILTVIIIIQTVISESKMKFALRLLLHTQSKVVLQIPKINDVLSGDFSNRVKDTTQRTDIFFENVVQNLPDAIIIANQQYQVVTCNSAFERIFHTQAIEGDVREFFQRKNFNQDVSKIFTDSQLTLNIEYMYDETKEFLTINCGVVNNHYVIMVCDETQTVCYNSLIVEERAKSDSLLASILPANLVKRVQDGETNISFSVESATITFMDIVEFTPWCASNTAAVVMMTLNQLYKLFDASLAMKPTMTKIKCIGDCYMAAGGIFSEINEPNTHAREVVEFCLECINAVNVLDAEMNQTLRIRAGVNTGGPLVAGVIGTEKPTFEIIGPCINMAQQMEHNGMPMLVHISRSVYELIYGGDFKIRERGQIQIKNGDVITYFVEGRKEEAQMK